MINTVSMLIIKKQCLPILKQAVNMGCITYPSKQFPESHVIITVHIFKQEKLSSDHLNKDLLSEYI